MRTRDTTEYRVTVDRVDPENWNGLEASVEYRPRPRARWRKLGVSAAGEDILETLTNLGAAAKLERDTRDRLVAQLTGDRREMK